MSRIIADLVKQSLMQMQEFEEGLIREHFADTPIALACIERLKIQPWDIVLQTYNEPLPLNPEADPAHPKMLIFSEKARVVEYLPRRWEAQSIRGKELTQRDNLFKFRAAAYYGHGIMTPPEAFVKVVP